MVLLYEQLPLQYTTDLKDGCLFKFDPEVAIIKLRLAQSELEETLKAIDESQHVSQQCLNFEFTI